MMKQIEKIYGNDFGMAFYWKREEAVLTEKVQFVFKEMGFYFTVSEMEEFTAYIEDSAAKNRCCANCEMKNGCVKFLLKTPCSQIDLAVSMTELNSIQDLVKGTLFKISMKEYVAGVGRN